MYMREEEGGGGEEKKIEKRYTRNIQEIKLRTLSLLYSFMRES